MKKRDLKKLALLGLASGALVSSQLVATEANIGDTVKASNLLAANDSEPVKTKKHKKSSKNEIAQANITKPWRSSHPFESPYSKAAKEDPSVERLNDDPQWYIKSQNNVAQGCGGRSGGHGCGGQSQPQRNFATFQGNTQGHGCGGQSQPQRNFATFQARPQGHGCGGQSQPQRFFQAQNQNRPFFNRNAAGQQNVVRPTTQDQDQGFFYGQEEIFVGEDSSQPQQQPLRQQLQNRMQNFQNQRGIAPRPNMDQQQNFNRQGQQQFDQQGQQQFDQNQHNKGFFSGWFSKDKNKTGDKQENSDTKGSAPRPFDENFQNGQQQQRFQNGQQRFQNAQQRFQQNDNLQQRFQQFRQQNQQDQQPLFNSEDNFADNFSSDQKSQLLDQRGQAPRPQQLDDQQRQERLQQLRQRIQELRQELRQNDDEQKKLQGAPDSGTTLGDWWNKLKNQAQDQQGVAPKPILNDQQRQRLQQLQQRLQQIRQDLQRHEFQQRQLENQGSAADQTADLSEWWNSKKTGAGTTTDQRGTDKGLAPRPQQNERDRGFFHHREADKQSQQQKLLNQKTNEEGFIAGCGGGCGGKMS